MAGWVLTWREPTPNGTVRLHYMVDDEARYAIVVRDDAATEWNVAAIGAALQQVHRRRQERRR